MSSTLVIASAFLGLSGVVRRRPLARRLSAPAIRPTTSGSSTILDS